MAPETTAHLPPDLPLSVIQPVEVGRLINELVNLDEHLHQLDLRRSGTTVQLPKTSHLLEQAAQINKLNLLQATDRQKLQRFLVTIQQQAPILHVSFSADPSPAFLEKLISWLRREIHPQVLLSIGLQPNIGAGCVVRSTNKYFDFSLRQDFANKRDLLKAALTSAPAPVPVTTTAPSGDHNG